MRGLEGGRRVDEGGECVECCYVLGVTGGKGGEEKLLRRGSTGRVHRDDVRSVQHWQVEEQASGQYSSRPVLTEPLM